MSNIKVPRACIFCSGTKDITDEHVVPNWLRHVVPRAYESHAIMGTRSGPTGARSFSKIRQGNAGTRTIHAVCVTCNTGWMRKLQDELQPILTPFIQGSWVNLTPQMGARISLWLAMTTCVIGEYYDNPQGTTQPDRSFVFERQAVPANWTVFVGRASGATDIYHANAVTRLTSTVPDENGTYPVSILNVTTIVLGQLLLQSIQVPLAELRPPEVYAQHGGLYQIHPWLNGQIDWRHLPHITFMSDEFGAVMFGFYNRVREILGFSPAQE